MTDEEIFELLKQQEEALLKKPTFYVHYDPITKNISSLRNYLDETDPFPHVELKEEDFDGSLSKLDITKYRIVLENGKNKLEKIVIHEAAITKINDFIYQIPKVVSDVRITADTQYFDLLIEQNNPLKEFRIKLSKMLREKFSLQSKDSQVIYLYVTAVNDPNILYKTLKCTIGQLIANEYYTLNFDDFQGDDVNIFGLKYFEEYLHVDIR